MPFNQGNTLTSVVLILILWKFSSTKEYRSTFNAVDKIQMNLKNFNMRKLSSLQLKIA